jgi:general secretion pathway protein D
MTEFLARHSDSSGAAPKGSDGTTMHKRQQLLLRRAVSIVVACALTACQTPSPAPVETGMAPMTTAGGSALSPGLADAAARMQAPPADPSRIFKGSGVLVKGMQPGGGLPPGPPVQPTGGGVVLNFEGADLREVVRNILGDILNENYTIAPEVGGTVTIRTSSVIPREALYGTLELLLRANGAAMVKTGALYQVVPSAVTVKGNVVPQLGNSTRALPPGFSVQIVPLRYVGVKEMMRILEPFAKDATAVRPDELRNMLILAGTERELKNLMDTIDMFDIDWMAGMSAGVFTLTNSDVKSVMGELDKIIGDKNTSPLAGILRIVPIERMNALLVITPQPTYLEEVKKWIERLDKGGGGDGGGLQFFVYNLQNQRAEKLGPLLQQAFTGRASAAAAATQPTLAPGTPAGSIVNPPSFTPTNPVTGTNAPAPVAAAAPAAAASGNAIVRNLQVVADKDNNTLLFVCTAAEYSVIEAALKKLDVPQRQVVMEVMIAEVTLKDEIQFGVDWLFKGGAPSGRGSGGNVNGLISSPTNPAVPPTAPNPAVALAQGFTYLLNNVNFPGGIQAALKLLDTYGNTKIVANPHVAALDNQKATIKSGDRIPINSNTTVGGTTNAITTTSQYIDTGVLLQVTPHINVGGLVTLEVQAEVSVPGNSGCAADQGCAPPIATRSVQTLLAVPSGRTMVMGGLINETRANTSQGIPYASRIPFLGGLFGNQALTNNRTELVLFITPRVVENEVETEQVIEGLRRRMERLDDVFPADRDNPPLPFTTTPRLFPASPFILPTPEKLKVPAPSGFTYTEPRPTVQAPGAGPGQIVVPQDARRVPVPGGMPLPNPTPPPAAGPSTAPPVLPSTVPVGAAVPYTPPPPGVQPPVMAPGLAPNPGPGTAPNPSR